MIGGLNYYRQLLQIINYLKNDILMFMSINNQDLQHWYVWVNAGGTLVQM